jgi:hypothetical protein
MRKTFRCVAAAVMAGGLMTQARSAPASKVGRIAVGSAAELCPAKASLPAAAKRFLLMQLALSPVEAGEAGLHIYQGRNLDRELDDFSPTELAAQHKLLLAGQQCFTRFDSRKLSAEDAVDLPATCSHIRCMASIATWSWSRPFSRTPPSSSSAPGASPVTPAHWHFSSHNSGEQSRHAGAHRFRGIRRRTRYPGALAQCRPAPLVPRKRPPSRAAYDADEHRPLQRARRRVASLHHLLTRAEFSNSFTTFVILNVNEVE